MIDQRPLKKIWMLAVGSRGDVQPYVAMAVALQKNGYEVRFYTSENLVYLPESFGITTISFWGKDNPMADSRASVNFIQFLKNLKAMSEAQAPHMAQVIHSEIEKGHLPDLVVSMHLTDSVAWYLAEKCNIPYYELLCQVFSFNPNHMQGGMPTLPFGLHGVIFKPFLGPHGSFLFHVWHEPYLKALDAAIAKQITRFKISQFLSDSHLPNGVMFSKELSAVLHPQAPSHYHFLGATAFSEKDQCSNLDGFGGSNIMKTLDDFIKAGTKPIYVGWGSVITSTPEKMLEFCTRAVHHSGQRAIVLGGFAQLSLEMLETKASVDPAVIEYAKSNILFVSEAPHEWLFSKVSVTVHHGGAGTTTAAFRSGVPTIITPAIFDQYDHSFLVRELQVGIGFKKQLDTIGWEELGDAIRTVVNDEDMAKRAVALSKKIRAEDGTVEFLSDLQSYWKDYCLTEEFHKRWAYAGGKEDQRAASRSKVITLAVFVGIAAMVVHYFVLPERYLPTKIIDLFQAK